MGMITISLSEDLVRAAKLGDGDVSRETAKLLALELFREEKVSIGRAAELAEVALAEFMDFAEKHGVHPLNYGTDELAEDLQTLSKLRS